MLYGPDVWDPVLIIAQIIAVQCIFYLGSGIFLTALVAPYAPKLALGHLFDWRWVVFGSFQGWMVATTFFCNSLVVAAALRFIVKRAKKCLDFASTAYFIHLIATIAYSGFPPRLSWWLFMGIDLSITALLGEWLCMQQELREIPLSSLNRRGRERNQSTELTSIVMR